MNKELLDLFETTLRIMENICWRIDDVDNDARDSAECERDRCRQECKDIDAARMTLSKIKESLDVS